MKTVYVHKLIFIMQTKQTLQMTVLKIVFQTDNFANKFKVTKKHTVYCIQKTIET